MLVVDMGESMLLKCYCGGEVDLTTDKRNQLLADVQVYCLPECFAHYILNQPETSGGLVKHVLHQQQITGDLYDKTTNGWYKSWFEVYVARFFRAENIEAKYEERTLPVPRGRVYTPDFWLPKYDLYVEVKGLWLAAGKKKFKAAMKAGYHMALLPWYLEHFFRKKYHQLYDNVIIK